MPGRHTFLLVIIAALTWACGCRLAHQTREPDYCALSGDIAQAYSAADPVGLAIDPIVEQLAGPHPVEDYIQIGLTQNPNIQAARLRVESLANRVPQAASLQDPTLGVTTFPQPIQTAAGQQELALKASQKVPWLGKLSTKADLAAHDVDVARAELAAAELAVVQQIKQAYYQLYFTQQALRITEQDKGQLQLIERIVNQKYRVQRDVSQQDLLRAQVEVARTEAELVRLRQQVQSAQALLARQLHISPETPLQAVDHLPAEQVPLDLEAFYRRAVTSRPELHAALAAVARDRRSADLARLNYIPDTTLDVTWIDTTTAGMSGIGNGRDAILVGVNVNVPIYHRRIEAGIREAETKAVATARQYDALKDQTLMEVKDLFVRATSQEQLLRLFRDDIIPKAQQTLEQSQAAYQVGQVDFQTLIDNWQDLLQFEISEKRLEAELRQSLASLARVIGSVEINTPAADELIPLPETEPAIPENDSGDL
jgi:cobalt-zinc-cadmium efflux system outer membrane protein